MKITQLNNHSDTHLTYPDTLELNKILTIIAGPNGYGKSSLLTRVKRSVQDIYKEERKFYSTFEVETSTQKSTIDSILSKPTYEQPNALIFTYDGYKENDFMTMLGLVACTYSVKLERIKYSEGQLRILDLKRIFELVNHAQQVVQNKDIPFVLLIDSVDSGLSPDFAIKIQQMIHQFVNHNASSNLRILLVSNTYELFQNWDEDKTDIIDAQTFEKVHFSSYEDYVTYCQERTSYEGRIVGTNIYRD